MCVYVSREFISKKYFDTEKDPERDRCDIPRDCDTNRELQFALHQDFSHTQPNDRIEYTVETSFSIIIYSFILYL